MLQTNHILGKSDHHLTVVSQVILVTSIFDVEQVCI